MLHEAGFVEAGSVGTGAYRTSAYTQATFYVARKPSGNHMTSRLLP